MDKSGISSLDLKFLKKELLKHLAGGIFKKVYQYHGIDGYQFIFEIYSPESKEEKNLLLYVDKSKAYLTKAKPDAPTEPPSFCMFLRKNLSQQKIRDIRQYKFDRILEIHTDNNILILEFFSKGNVILCDSFQKIIMPFDLQSWKDRQIKPKLPYKYPPTTADPFEIDLDELRNLASKTEKNLVSFLAVSLGFGGDYANEVCKLANLDPQKPANKASLEDLAILHKTIENFGKKELSSTIYENFISPFPLEIFKDKRRKETLSFSEALEEFFSGREEEKIKSKQEQEEKKSEDKVQRILESRKEAVEKHGLAEKELKQIADDIYNNYQLVDTILLQIKRAIFSGKSWPEIKQYIQTLPESKAVKEIREREGIVVVSLSGKEVSLDFRKSVEENAGRFYENVKHERSKKEGAILSLGKIVKEEKKPEIKVAVKRLRKKWYEKFRWFFSSSGFLVVAGRDANDNEKIVKKHAETGDVLFHADIHGAAFVLIKNQGKPIDQITIKEASEFSAANSKAWTKNIGSVDVFSFKPEQATKPVHLPKGSFVIEGPREWFKDLELKLSIGVKIDKEKNEAKIISGPVMSVRSYSNYFVTIKPGYKESLDLAREIKNKILLKSKPEDKFLIDKIPLEDIQRCIPSGKGDIEEGTGL